MKGEKSPETRCKKLRLPIIRSISRSKLAKTERRVGGCDQKSMVPKQIWFPSIVELLLGGDERTAELMIPTPRIPTIGAN
jgi:hypothetical protein